MATHSSILAWKNPRTEEPGRLQSMGSQRVGLLHTVRSLEPGQLKGAVEDPGFGHPPCGFVSSCLQGQRCCSIR